MSIATSTQTNHANPYGDLNQMKRTSVKPPITEKLHNTMASIASWTWRITIASMIISGIGTFWLNQSSTPVTGAEATTMSLVVFGITIAAGTFVGIGVICGVIFAFVVGKQSKQLESMKEGHYLARWDLEQEQWTAYINQEKEKAKDSIMTSAVVCLFIGLILCFPMAGAFSMMTCILGVLGMGVAGAVLGMVISAVRRYRLCQKADSPQFTVVGHDGLYFNNGYIAYSSFGSGLSGVQLVETGEMEYLVFTFYNETNNGRSEYDRRVPVPRGREDEAAWVLKQLV